MRKLFLLAFVFSLLPSVVFAADQAQCIRGYGVSASNGTVYSVPSGAGNNIPGSCDTTAASYFAGNVLSNAQYNALNVLIAAGAQNLTQTQFNTLLVASANYSALQTQVSTLQTQVTFLQASGVASSTEFDPAMAAAFWSFAMTLIVGLWIVAKNAGTILRMVEGWRR